MMSKARLDLPDPESPVTTVRVPRGISTSMFFRLCCRAPRTVMRSITSLILTMRIDDNRPIFHVKRRDRMRQAATKCRGVRHRRYATLGSLDANGRAMQCRGGELFAAAFVHWFRRWQSA